MTPCTIVVPMAGLGSRFSSQGYALPKPFIDVLGRPMIHRVLDNLYMPKSRFVLIVRKEHLEAYPQWIQALENQYPCDIVSIDSVTEGAACTVLLARHHIPADKPLLIANSDQLVDIAMVDFVLDAQRRQAAGSILTFEAHETKWSYAKVSQAGWVEEVREKEVISSHATVGIYYFQRGQDFVENALDMILAQDRVNREFYVCPVYNYLIKKEGNVGIYEIPQSAMQGLGTPEDLMDYLSRKNA